MGVEVVSGGQLVLLTASKVRMPCLGVDRRVNAKTDPAEH